MLAVERSYRNERQMERRAKPARRSSRLIYPKTAARRLHQSRSAHKNQNPQNGHLMARFDWGLGAVCFGASPVAAVFGSAPGSATPPEHRIHSNPTSPAQPFKTGHFYFAGNRTFLLCLDTNEPRNGWSHGPHWTTTTLPASSVSGSTAGTWSGVSWSFASGCANPAPAWGAN